MQIVFKQMPHDPAARECGHLAAVGACEGCGGDWLVGAAVHRQGIKLSAAFVQKVSEPARSCANDVRGQLADGAQVRRGSAVPADRRRGVTLS